MSNLVPRLAYRFGCFGIGISIGLMRFAYTNYAEPALHGPHPVPPLPSEHLKLSFEWQRATSATVVQTFDDMPGTTLAYEIDVAPNAASVRGRDAKLTTPLQLSAHDRKLITDWPTWQFALDGHGQLVDRGQREQMMLTAPWLAAVQSLALAGELDTGRLQRVELPGASGNVTAHLTSRGELEAVVTFDPFQNPAGELEHDVVSIWVDPQTLRMSEATAMRGSGPTSTRMHWQFTWR